MLSGLSLGDNALLAHHLAQQCLPERIVGLMCAAVQQILSLQKDLRAPFVRQIFGMIERGGATSIVSEKRRQPRLKLIARHNCGKRLFQLFESRHERFRHVYAAVSAEFS